MITDLSSVFRSTLRRWAGLGTSLLVLALVLVGCDTDVGSNTQPETPSINDIATEVAALSTLGSALQETGLDSELADGGPFTVFAPLNDAFAPPVELSGNPAVLRKVLRHHVVSGTVTSSQLSNGQTIQPLAGDELTISINGGVMVNRATVTNPDVNASNGVVHVVDGLLIDAVDRARITPRFSIFADLVAEANLESVLRAGGANDGRTIFAPTNTALLDALDTNDNDRVDDSEIPANVADILSYHVLDSVFRAADVPASETAVETLEGSDVTVVRDADSGAVTLNPNDEGASVTIPDVIVDNGVIHGIDTVLLP
jgi:uncharacterized surface protein with fasciclin (FAS1) repeats